MWYISIELDKEPEELEKYRDLRTPKAFQAAFNNCGLDYGCRSDSTALSDHMHFFESEDPAFAKAYREWGDAED